MYLKKIMCIVGITTSMLLSCTSSKEVVYFQESQHLEKVVLEPKKALMYNSGDRLRIQVFSPDPEAALPFNRNRINIEEESNSTPFTSYVIDEDGYIIFPILGKIRAKGLTRKKLEEGLEKKLLPYINEPTVSIQFESFKITVLGQVNNPGTFVIPEEKVTIIDAIGLAKDLNIKGKRNNITVIREGEKEKTYYKVDLTSKSLFLSPAYLLAPNDVVYVEPNKSGVRASNDISFNRVLTATSSVLSVILSVLLLTTR